MPPRRAAAGARPARCRADQRPVRLRLGVAAGRVTQLAGLGRRYRRHQLGQFLLKYVISHPAVTCAIPGSTQVAHLIDNQGAARGRLPDEAMRRRMEQFWDSASG